MKYLLELLLALIVAMPAAKAQTVVTTTTTTTTTVPENSTYAPGKSVVVVNSGRISPQQTVVVSGESDLYHRQPRVPQVSNGTVLAIGAGAAAGALLWDGGYHRGYRHGRRRYRNRYYRHRHW